MTDLLHPIRWIEQSIDDSELGDCLPACLSALTGLDVPSESDSDAWWPKYEQWLHERGWRMRTQSGRWWPVEPAIAGIPSPTYPNVGHAVIVLGRRVIWDPSPRRNDARRVYGAPRYHITVTRIRP